ncbi:MULTISPECIES: MarR family winged helix-turn-helix transcriptional regulator [unclassified Nitratireductor]|uniref:MarR family winged helix-turn-helix transcriptional regulator n=1 Tax=unclassified Nitratireductor TaxID=2641084 RepID=UPI0025E4AEE3|nr:MarR family winged helix-turn-helix transcriptional regulator [Nitratireductor sp.]
MPYTANVCKQSFATSVISPIFGRDAKLCFDAAVYAGRKSIVWRFTVKMTQPSVKVSTGSPGNEYLDVFDSNAQSPCLPLLATAIGYKLRRAQLVVFQDFQKSFACVKLRPTEFAVLSLIATNPGQKQTEVAEQLGIKRANFVALMDCLETRGLAERRKGDIDRRSHSLHLTEKGSDFIAEISKLWAQHEKRIIERLGGEDNRDALIALLDRLLAGKKRVSIPRG